MNKFLLATLFGLLMALPLSVALFAPPALAEDCMQDPITATDWNAEVTTGARLRDIPCMTTSVVITTLPVGEVIKVIAVTDGYYQIRRADGTEGWVGQWLITATNKAFTPAGATPSPTPTPTPTPTETLYDIKGHIYEEAIRWMNTNGIISGYPDGSFKPDNKINRAEFTKILVGTALSYDPSKDPSGFDIYSLSQIPFTDIVNNDWYIPYVRKAIQNGIISGYPDNTFKGANLINKAEAAKIIVKSLGLKTLAESYNTNWYDIYIYALEEKYAVPADLTCSDMTVTRAQLAEIIFRLKNNITNKESANSHVIENGKLKFVNTPQTSACNEAIAATENPTGSTTTSTTGPAGAKSSTAKTIILDDSDPANGTTMYDFDTEQRTNTDVSPDMMMSGMFYESTWMHGMDWQVVPMEGKFEDIAACPAEGYANVYNVDPATGFGTPYNAYQGDIYCLKTSDGKLVLLEILEDFNATFDRYLKIKYLFK